MAVAPEPSALQAVLEGTSCASFKYGPTKPLVVIRAHWSLRRALSVLSTHRIQSCPLLRRVGTAWQVSGVVDVMDVATAVVAYIKARIAAADGPPSSPAAVPTLPAELGGQATPTGAAGKGEQVDLLEANLSCNNPTTTIAENLSLLHALPSLSSKVRRLLITDAGTGGVIGLVTQSDVLQTVLMDYDAFDSFSQVKLADIPGVFKHLYTCKTSTPALDVVSGLLERNLSAVAVLDEAGEKMVANISISDIRGLAAMEESEWVSALQLPALKFLALMRGDDPSGYALFSDSAGGRKADRVISVRPTDVLGTAVNLLQATKLHRIWVVDRDGKPHGVLSLSDILSVVKDRVKLPKADDKKADDKADDGAGGGGADGGTDEGDAPPTGK